MTTLEADLRTISEIEFDNGHGTWRRDGCDQLGIGELSLMSKAVGRVLSGAADVCRHISVVQMMLDHIRDHTPPATFSALSNLTRGTLKETLPCPSAMAKLCRRNAELCSKSSEQPFFHCKYPSFQS